MNNDPVLSFYNNAFMLCTSDGKDREITFKEAATGFKRYSDKTAQKVLDRALNKSYPVPSLPPLPFLDPHQLTGVNWILTRARSYLAHAPGAGKTAQVIVASQLIDSEFQSLYLVPPSLTLNWEREVLKFTESFEVWPSIGMITADTLKNSPAWGADFLIVSSSIFMRPVVYERLVRKQFKLIAVDEASGFKDPLAKRSIGLYGGVIGEERYPGLYQNSKHVVFMDGSPMPNRPMELWAPTIALSPQTIDFMTQSDFGFKYCGAKLNNRGVWEFLHDSNLDELRARLQKNFMHVVTDKELPHPERKRSIVFLSKDVRSSEQKTWERKNLQGLESLDEDASRGELAKYRLELGLKKTDLIYQYIHDKMQARREKILLFVWHREVAEILSVKLQNYKPRTIIGGVSARYRELAFKDFQEGDCDLLIINIIAGGRGHNLFKAKRVVFGEFSWTDELNKQCEHRAARRGSEELVIPCDYLAVPNSMDEKVLNSNFTKEKRTRRAIG